MKITHLANSEWAEAEGEAADAALICDFQLMDWD